MDAREAVTFDLMLIAQALLDDLVPVSNEQAFGAHGARFLVKSRTLFASWSQAPPCATRWCERPI
jgi:hypothetical protein